MNNDAPQTIHSPDIFGDNAPAGFDGFFDWHWVSRAVKRATKRNITPMDIDAHIEVKGHFLIFETKRDGVSIPEGQQRALFNLWARGYTTLVFLWGKSLPIKAEIYYPSGRRQTVRQNLKEAQTKEGLMTQAELEEIVEGWAAWANKNPCPYAYNVELISKAA